MKSTDLIDICDAHEKLIPFNKLLGIKIVNNEKDNLKIRLDMRDDLVGNFIKGILHGGVISSVLDVTGGMAAALDVIDQMDGKTRDEIATRLGNMGTIDMRVDFLRPGKGEYFLATGHVMRTGATVAVTRMELFNDNDLLIAVGTGTYYVG